MARSRCRSHGLTYTALTHSVDKIVGKIKGYTSKVLREEYPSLKSRLPSLWTRSKFVSSCGGVTLEIIKDYIEGQSGQ